MDEFWRNLIAFCLGGLTVVAAVVFKLIFLDEYLEPDEQLEVQAVDADYEVSEQWVTGRLCIDGHWYIERAKTEGALIGHYGMAPIFDDEGRPVRCPKKQ